MYKIDIFKRKSDGNRGAYLLSAYYPTKEDAYAAYEVYRKLSFKGRRCAPRDAEVKAHSDAVYKEKAAQTGTYKVWSCKYDEKAECNKEKHVDKRYTWTYEVVQNKNKVDPQKITGPEFVLTTKLSNIIVAKPVATTKY